MTKMMLPGGDPERLRKREAKRSLAQSYEDVKAFIGIGETEDGFQCYWNKNMVAPMYLNQSWEGYSVIWNFIEPPEAFEE